MPVGPLLVAAAFCAMFVWTAGGWPDPQIDFGRELYVPWQLARGQVLHRDIAVIYGPLSQYFNALWFALFGPGLWVLVAVNAALFAALLALLYGLVRRVADRPAATLACLLAVALFGFGQYVPAGNYNFLTPYCHEATHGLLLALAGLACLAAFLARGDARWAGAAGLAVGAAFLTKLEPFVAAFAATSLGIALGLWSERAPAGRGLRTALAYAAGLLLPPALAWALLQAALSPGDALRGVLGSWAHLGNPELVALPFFRSGIGSDALGRNLARIALGLAWCAALAVPPLGLALGLRGAGRRARLAACALVFGAVAGVLLALDWREFWIHAGRPLPVLAAGALAGALARLRGVRDQPDARARSVLRVALAALAFAMLLRMLLNARLHHYGFVLALPATALVTAMAVSSIPAWIRRRGGAPAVFQAAALAVALAAAAAHLQQTGLWIARKTVAVGAGRDRFVAEDRGRVLAEALEQIRKAAPPEATLVVLPEGVMLNYLARRRNPTPYVSFLPPELIIFGEERVVASLREARPDLVVLLQRDTGEYGVGGFGSGYGGAIREWLTGSYHQAAPLIGKPGPGNADWALIFERNARAAPPRL